MNKIVTNFLIATALIAVFGPTLALAADNGPGGPDGDKYSSIGKGLAVLGAGVAVLGAGLGIGFIGKGASEATARQPEVAGKIFTLALITAAFIEGVALFAVAGGFLAT